MSQPVPFSWIAVAIISTFMLIGAASLSTAQTSAAPSAPTNPAAAAAAPAEVAAAPAAGRPLTKSDWIAHIPLWLGMIIFVVVVDTCFVVKILYDRSRQRAAAPVGYGMPPR